MDTSINVLIVDDDRSMLHIIRTLLVQLGFAKVDQAGDAEAALAMLRAKRYGLVISDWNMEPMSGLALLHAVRADVRLRHLPFVMVTGDSTREKLHTAKQAGVSEYLVKPFNAEALRAGLSRALGQG